MSEDKAVLSAHAGARKVTLKELADLPEPRAMGKIHRPIAHIELVEALREAVKDELGAKVEKIEVAIGKGGYGIPDARMFGVMQVSYGGREDLTGAIGFRHANDRSMSAQMVAGARVFVCDNMVFHGDSVILTEKHTKNLDISLELKQGMAQFREHFERLDTGIKAMKATKVSEDGAKALIFTAFVQREVAPLRLMPAVAHEWFEPAHEDFRPRTMWSLHNAFTEVFKQLPVTNRQRAIQEVGTLLTHDGE